MSHLANGKLTFRMTTESGYIADGSVEITVEQWAKIEAILKGTGVVSAKARTRTKPELIVAIMNLPLGNSYDKFVDEHETRTAYQEGHRDARHAAAEEVICIP